MALEKSLKKFIEYFQELSNKVENFESRIIKLEEELHDLHELTKSFSYLENFFVVRNGTLILKNAKLE